MDQSEIVTLIIIGYVVLSTLSFLIAVLIIYRLLRRITLLWPASEETFGGNAKTRLIGLGLASFVFPSVIPAFFLTIFNFVTGLFRELLSALPRGLEFVRQACQVTQNDANCAMQSAMIFLDTWSRAISSAISSLDLNSFPYGSLVLMLALWSVISEFLRNGTTAGQQGETGNVWLYDAFARLQPVTRQNLYFFLVLAIASYLSVAAITAIPGLREAAPDSEKVSVEKLQQQLDQAQQEADSSFKRELKLTNPFGNVEELIKKYEGATANQMAATDNTATQAAPSPAQVATPAPSPTGKPPATVAQNNSPKDPPQPTPTSTPTVVASPINEPIEPTEPSGDDVQRIRVRYLEQKALRDELLKEHEKLAQNALSQLKDMKATIVATYEANNAYRLGGREKVQHFLALPAFFRERIGELDLRLNECASAIGNSDVGWRFWSSQLTDDLTYRRELTSFTLDLPLREAYRNSLNACRPVLNAKSLPERAALGSFLGPFGLVARWLLSTESLPLALITGLLGFGLLGSACSTFVRERARRTGDGPLVIDLPSVVIRGLSAAIVVFLTVEGGLAIFASSGSEPNPYVLLLTCLVAAVFSEDVWKWAHQKLLDNFQSNEEVAEPQRRDKTATGTTPTATPTEKPAPVVEPGERQPGA